MALTPEQNEQINTMRNQLQQMLTALNQLARQVGADPIPLEGEEGFVFTNPLPQVQGEEIQGGGPQSGPPPINPIKYYEAPGVVNGIRVKPIMDFATAMATVTDNNAAQPQQQQQPQAAIPTPRSNSKPQR
jgi:Tfp pilus assembly protein FimV